MQLRKTRPAWGGFFLFFHCSGPLAVFPKKKTISFGFFLFFSCLCFAPQAGFFKKTHFCT
ncbi:hypothetical protein Hdeb2414_s0014g00433371 [Helianthus debilis subsp. tardiflorus]